MSSSATPIAALTLSLAGAKAVLGPAAGLTAAAPVRALREAARAAFGLAGGAQLTLMCGGRRLVDDDATLGSYGVADGKLVMVLAAPAAAAAAAEAPAAAAAAAASAGAGAGGGAGGAAAAVVDLAALRRAEIERFTAAARVLAARAPSGRWGPQLLTQSGSAVFVLSPRDAAAVQEALALHARGRFVLACAERESREEAAAAAAAADAASASAAAAPAAAAAAAAAPEAAAAVSAPEAAAGAEAREVAVAAAAAAAAATLREKRSLALALYLSAEEALSRVADAALLDRVDNAAHLALDTCWLYALLGERQHVAAAAACLERARRGFERAHGADLARLEALHGAGSAERLAYVRLNLLEGLVAFHAGRAGQASIKLEATRASIARLRVRPAAVEALRRESAALAGVGDRELAGALRAVAVRGDAAASGGPGGAAGGGGAGGAAGGEGMGVVDRIITYVYDAREREERAEAAACQAARDASRARRLGPTLGGHAINLRLLDALSAQFDAALAVEALRLHDNDQEAALQALSAPDLGMLIEAVEARRAEREARRAAAFAGGGGGGGGGGAAAGVGAGGGGGGADFAAAVAAAASDNVAAMSSGGERSSSYGDGGGGGGGGDEGAMEEQGEGEGNAGRSDDEHKEDAGGGANELAADDGEGESEGESGGKGEGEGEREEEDLAAAIESGVLDNARWFGGMSTADEPFGLLRVEAALLEHALGAIGR